MLWYEEVCAVQQTIPETIRKVHWNVGKEPKNPSRSPCKCPVLTIAMQRTQAKKAPSPPTVTVSNSGFGLLIAPSWPTPPSGVTSSYGKA
jgi:hypothetical protein